MTEEVLKKIEDEVNKVIKGKEAVVESAMGGCRTLFTVSSQRRDICRKMALQLSLGDSGR